MSVFSNRASDSPAQASAYTGAILGLLGAREPIGVLQSTAASLRDALDGLSKGRLTEPEAPEKWSMRHVLQHLADAELVWGYRLRMVLAHERPPLIGFDQDLWAERLRYRDVDPERAIEDFSMLRQMNLRLLEGAPDQDYLRVGLHAERGEESVERMTRLMAGHDLMHLRQLDRIRGNVTGAPAV